MSNLPPGVTPSDIDNAYGSSVEPHSHEFRLAESPAVVFEDGAVIVTYECTFVEIRGSYHSSRRDEVYYDEGASCPKQRQLRLDTDAPEDAVVAIERTFRDDSTAVTELIDDMTLPAELRSASDTDGRVVASTDNIAVTYTT